MKLEEAIDRTLFEMCEEAGVNYTIHLEEFSEAVIQKLDTEDDFFIKFKTKEEIKDFLRKKLGM